MSTRRERAERKHAHNRLMEGARFKTGQDLACAYGSHLFKWEEFNSHLHQHVCTNCGATYLESGKLPCYKCKPERPDPEEHQ